MTPSPITIERNTAGNADIVRQMLRYPTELAAAYRQLQGDRASLSHREAGLTNRMRELMAFITEYYEIHDITPSYDEMKEALDLQSKSGIHRLVTALEERGYVSRIPNRARSIVIHHPVYRGHQTSVPLRTIATVHQLGA